MTRRDFIGSATALTVSATRRSWITADLLHGSRNLHWLGAEHPVGMGSLLKPFLVLAYGLTHTGFPVIHCNGAKDGCWLSRGHGEQDIVSGMANSCNAYFLVLSNAIDRAALDSICLAYGLTAPDRSATIRHLIGLDSGWPQAPLAVADAFARLAQNRRMLAVDTVLAGMERCATGGTARATGLNCYAKTGTAPCTHTPHAPGDGFVCAIYPRIQPRYVTLLEEHGTTGAEAARDLLRKLD